MKHVYAIPSYKRPAEQRTVELLRSQGIERDRVFIFVQNEADYVAYEATGWATKARLLYFEGANVSENRNNILDYFPEGQQIVMMDDDISEIALLHPNGKGLITCDSIDRVCETGFRTAQAEKTVIWGIYPVANDYFMKHKVDRRAIIEGTMFGIINTDLRFDRKLGTKEDYDYSCKVMARHEKAIRMRNITAVAKHRSAGGCEEAWQQTAADAAKLIKRWPQFLKANSKRPGEVLFKR